MQRRSDRTGAILSNLKVLAFASCLASLAGCALSDGGAFSLTPNAALEAVEASSTEESAEIARADATADGLAGEAMAIEGGDDATERAADEGVGHEVKVATTKTVSEIPQTPSTTRVAATDEEASPAETGAAVEQQARAEYGIGDEDGADLGVAALAVVEPEENHPSPFARLFSRPGATTDDPSVTEAVSPRATEAASDAASIETEGNDEPAEAATSQAAAMTKPAQITTASITLGSPRARLNVAGGEAALPGVREVSSIYELSRRDSFDYYRYDNGNDTIQMASAVGLAALAGSRLAVQHDNVDVSCLKPRLVQTLKRIEAHFGRPVIVTSGYRDRGHNRRVGGARRSKHMSCEAADIQIAGVSKWDIAEYARSLSGRGGVGTYCHTESVHVDVGSKRDWNWRCRRRR